MKVNSKNLIFLFMLFKSVFDRRINLNFRDFLMGINEESIKYI